MVTADRFGIVMYTSCEPIVYATLTPLSTICDTEVTATLFCIAAQYITPLDRAGDVNNTCIVICVLVTDVMFAVIMCGGSSQSK